MILICFVFDFQGLSLLINIARFLLLTNSIGHWSEMILLLQVSKTLDTQQIHHAKYYMYTSSVRPITCRGGSMLCMNPPSLILCNSTSNQQ